MEIIFSFFQNLLRSLQSELFNQQTQTFLIEFSKTFAIFLVLVFLSLMIARYASLRVIRLVITRLAPQQFGVIYDKLISPIEGLFQIAGTFILLALSLNVLENYQAFYDFLRFFNDLALVLSLAWLASRLVRQVMRVYGLEIIRKLGREVDELLLVFETLINIFIGFIAAIAFAQSQQINLVGLLASVGIGGLAIAFAAQKTLEQLLGTLVLYLDRPFIPGEYIRMWSWPAFPDGALGNVESIGLRSTKIRIVAKGTLIIVPNSVMANLDVVENITRSKKVMALLYLDFMRPLKGEEEALVEQVVKQSTNALFGIDPGSTRITLFQPENKPGTRARVTFFILGSNENSFQLRKRLLELANDTITEKLIGYGIEFTCTEPTVYVDSPVTI
ncbi:MscS Mechanosensitive ion channel [Halothece sp. PCC 7418]|uniref:mechanosensitive ion channel family protein n=2 Tax=Bacteria TaxID=2 RepID=UPI0002A06980|nr:mechanosensitive ion channel domain-containing protein [Halothece sp. PCC 7418]AFZ43062.1 MscS Mechanosensitive ion channel [Halothece sp. PCC 7418]